MSRLRRALLAGAAGVVYAVVTTTVAAASFVAVDTSSVTVSTNRIFPTSQTTSAWDLLDASAGTIPAAATDVWAAVDARIFTTATLTTAFSSTRYVDLTLSGPLAPAVPVTAATLNLTMASSGGGTGCVYAEIRRATTNALLGTVGSSATPFACSATAIQATTTSPLSFVTSSTDANDLRIRVFLRNSTSQKIAFDRVTAAASAYGSTVTLFETSIVNRSSGTAATTPWALAAADSATYAPVSSWTSAFTVSRYLQAAFPATVPDGAVITGVTLRHAYASTAASTTSCVYIETYNGATLLGTHGTAANPYCNSTTTQTIDSVDLPEVDTAAEVNNLTVRIYVRNGGSGATRHGLMTLTVDYELV